MGDHITKIYMNNISKDKVFSFGYGIVKDIKETVKFKNLSSIQISKEDMISYYYGGNLQEEFKKSKFRYASFFTSKSNLYFF